MDTHEYIYIQYIRTLTDTYGTCVCFQYTLTRILGIGVVLTAARTNIDAVSMQALAVFLLLCHIIYLLYLSIHSSRAINYQCITP